MGYDAHFRVWRGDADGGDLQEFTVQVNEGEVVLDVIHRLQATQTPDLAVRWNCKAGKCGSCSAEINGRPRLMCMTRMSTFDQSETITVTPMRTFPIVRDLVTDVSFNYQKAREIPAFSPPADLKPGDFRMSQIDVERSQEFRKCIECFLCQDTCHVIRDHEENKPKFSGPRMFIRVAELDMHPLDTLDRKRQAQEQFGLGYCNITKCCTEVCPEHIHITDNAIIPMKERVVDVKYDPLLIMGARIPSRAARQADEDLRHGNPKDAETQARARVERKPGDQSALGALAAALIAQGRFAEAADVATRRMAVVGGRGRARRDSVTASAWSMLCGIEAGQLSYDAETKPRVDGVVREAIALNGNVPIAGKASLYHWICGDTELAEREARDTVAWHRPDAEQADGQLTLVHVLHARGDEDGARAALKRAEQLAPSSPRLTSVRRVLGVDAPAGG
jgi:succinate dehydrogenase / fumarate reductase iron-sulfur subunit